MTVTARPTMALTSRQLEIYEAVERHGGNLTNAARELGITQVSTGDTYRRALVRLGLPLPERLKMNAAPTYRDQVEQYGARLDAIEAGIAAIAADRERMLTALADLTNEIRDWTRRQPVYVEMRPINVRKADGGKGGVAETRGLRQAVRG